ncbi:amino acid permease [bacterium]|nr:amino acid permease [bacterium]
MSKGINCDIIHGMKPPNNRFIRAVGTMVGSVVGVGVFGLPYAFEKSGPVLGALVLVLLAGVISGMQLMYAEVALHTPGNHRLVGYVRALLGEGWARFAVVALSAGLWGSMLAYMIVGGSFLRELFAPGVAGAEFWFGLGLAAVAGFLMSRGTQAVAKLEVAAVALLGFLFAFMTLAALPHARFAYLSGVHWDAMLVPYGVAFFALAGMGVIPEMKAVLGTAREKELPCAVLTAMSIIAGLYLAFALVVVSVLGPKTTQSAFVGLVPVLGGSFRVAASVLGSTVVLSIFSMIGVELSNTFRFDFRARTTFRGKVLVEFSVCPDGKFRHERADGRIFQFFLRKVEHRYMTLKQYYGNTKRGTELCLIRIARRMDITGESYGADIHRAHFDICWIESSFLNRENKIFNKADAFSSFDT